MTTSSDDGEDDERDDGAAERDDGERIAAKRDESRPAARGGKRAGKRIRRSTGGMLREPRTPLKDRLPTMRDRLTTVDRLRRRTVASDQVPIHGSHARAQPDHGDPSGRRVLGDRFRLVCWNIEDGLDVAGAIEALTGHPNLRDADAICLQEMDPGGVERIALTLNLNFFYLESSKDERSERGFGNAILSPWPLSDHVTAPLPHVAKAYGRPRAAIGATVNPTTTGDPAPFAVWSVHAEIPSLSLSRRVAQYTAIAAKAAAANPRHLLIAGDFNTTTATSVLALDELYGLFDLDRLTAPAGPSLRRAGRLFRLDHIYGRGVDVAAVGIEREVIASDHWPVWIEIGVRPTGG